MSRFVRNFNGYNTLNDGQKKYIGEELKSSVINKQHPHESDMAKSASLLFKVAESGYLITDHVVESILQDTNENWSDVLIERLKDQGNVASYIVEGIYEMNHTEFVSKLKQLSN